MTHPTTELVPSISIANLLGQRDAMVERLRRAATAIQELAELSQAAFGNDDAVPALECRRSHAYFPDQLDALIKRVDAAAWDWLMSQSGLRTLMDATAREQWQKNIYERQVPELTMENIQATFRQLFDSRQQMFERGVIEVFRKLSWNYKTNSPVKFGRRIILNYLLDRWGTGPKRYLGGPSSSGCNRLDDLIRVMSILDGKPEPDHRQGAYQALRGVIIYNNPLPKEPIVVADLLSIRCYRNGNGHVTFLRPDLVDRLNEIIADHYPGALPPARE